MKSGKFHGIGIGPGDPDLITIKAVKILEKVDIVIAPFSKNQSIAYKIVSPYIKGQVVKLRFPMIRDKRVLEGFWENNTRQIKAMLDEGKDVAFITLGDPMIYSTYIYIFNRLKDYDRETVPGIPSFCAAAAKLGISIAEGDDPFVVVPTSDEKIIDKALEDFDNVILMKVSRNFNLIAHKLKEKGFKTGFVSRCCHENEEIHYDLDNLKNQKVDYLSLVIGKKAKQ